MTQDKVDQEVRIEQEASGSLGQQLASIYDEESCLTGGFRMAADEVKSINKEDKKGVEEEAPPCQEMDDQEMANRKECQRNVGWV